MSEAEAPPQELIAALTNLVGRAGVVTDPEELAPLLTDWRGRYQGRALCAVRPATTGEVAAVVAWLRSRGVPLVPQGGNTSLCGAATPDDSGTEVLLSLARMNRIRSVDGEDNLLVAEAGAVLADVQRAAENVGRLFPLSLASEGTAQLGGLIGTNAGGTAVLRYGMMRDLVLGLEVVLPSGEILPALRGLRKDNTGYDLKQLFIGAEGTLGVVTAASLKLFPRPREMVTAWVAVPDLPAAVRLLRRIQDEVGDNVTTFELMADVAVGLALAHVPGLSAPLGAAAPFAVLLEVASFWRAASAQTAVEAVLAQAQDDGLLLDATVARDESQARALWAVREAIPEGERRSGSAVKHDISVRPALIARFVAEARAALETTVPGAQVIVFGHLGDGSLHFNVVPPGVGKGRIPADVHARIWRVVHDLVAAHDGSISAEHGIGQLKRDELDRYRSPVERQLQRTIKVSLDPQGLVNPGKLL